MLAVIWTMPLATIDATVLIIDATVPIIDATVLISGLSLLILVAGPVLLVLGADEESSAASVMPSLAADPGRGDQDQEEEEEEEEEEERTRGGEDRLCSLRQRQLSSS